MPANDAGQHSNEAEQDAGAEDVDEGAHAVPEQNRERAKGRNRNGQKQHDCQLVLAADVVILLRGGDGQQHEQR
ncbi:hypothetical protein SRABI128_04065 [Microbacterium sp. Bi128]|nr:hypothetical protein SRABI128_04065 [Microbacterium sp. Bi128]